ncbi:MAG: N-acetylmuramoyl-L-alanine amidase [Rothia sp. (in: high G+C Gram-positive bacteria)]|nr:N-acetylmuramoyl-L-alanine amidase [Rothia sp. (in: high G+C Gram-positive bacteria)]
MRYMQGTAPSRRLFARGASGFSLGSAIGLGTSRPKVQAHKAAALDRPKIYSCADWGAQRAQQPIALGQKPTHIAIHHTSMINRGPQPEKKDKHFCQQTQANHMAELLAADTLHNFTITQSGRIFEGRHRSLEMLLNGKRGVLTGRTGEGQYANARTVGIQTEGDFSQDLLPLSQYRSLVHMVAFICQQYGIPVSHILGPRDYPSKEGQYPGQELIQRLNILRADVAQTLAIGSLSVANLTRIDQTYGYPQLYPNSRDPAVKNAQRELIRVGYNPGFIYGTFCPQTVLALKLFQVSLGIRADGILSEQSWCALLAAGPRPRLLIGSRGEDVLRVQRALNARQLAGLAEDAEFGLATLDAVRTYQRRTGLTPDGIVGSKTWALLHKGR